MTDTLIQTIAKALWIGESYFKDIPDNVVTPRHYLDTAKATLTALQDAGYAIVPRGVIDEAFFALDASHVGLDDWLHTYASDMCGEEHVQASRANISEGGGTLAYIAKLQQENRLVLRELWALRAAITTGERNG